METLFLQRRCPPDGVFVVRVAPIDDCVSRREEGRQRVNGLLDGGAGGPAESDDEAGERRRARARVHRDVEAAPLAADDRVEVARRLPPVRGAEHRDDEVAPLSPAGESAGLDAGHMREAAARDEIVTERQQAEDRIHRPGQMKRPTYTDIYCINSIDRRIDEAIAKKGNAVEQFRREVEKVRKDRIKELIRAL